MKQLTSIITIFLVSIFLITKSKAQEVQANGDITIKDASVIYVEEFSQNTSDASAYFAIYAGQKYIEFELEKNTRLLAKNPSLMDGFILYKGRIKGNVDSWARFTYVNDTVVGSFYDGEKLYNVTRYAEIADTISKDSEFLNHLSREDRSFGQNLTVAIDFDDYMHTGICGNEEHAHINQSSYQDYIQNLQDLTASSVEALDNIFEIDIEFIADVEFATYHLTHPSNPQDPVVAMLTYLNFADGVFSEQIGVLFSLVNTTILTSNGNYIENEPLKMLEVVRDDNTLINDGLRHLFTNKEIFDVNGNPLNTVGIAYVGSICGDGRFNNPPANFSSGWTKQYNSVTNLILTHELGHNFNSPHDNQSGSLCEGTPNDFIMNPFINSQATSFSECSVGIMNTYVNTISLNASSCLRVVELPTLTITSEPNTFGKMAEAYVYDNDATIDAEGTAPFTYSLDIGPEGMAIDDNGVVSWIPTGEQVGANFVQITVSNGIADDTQTFVVEVTSDFIDFSEYEVQSYGGSQDVSGAGTIGVTNPYELTLTGNSWKKIPFVYPVTPFTILEFDFNSSVEGEIHGIGFDDDNTISIDKTFNIYGTQKWGVNGFKYNDQGKQRISIPIGLFYQGDFRYLTFTNDNDANLVGVDSFFSNVEIYELEESPAFLVDFNNSDLVPHAPGAQDVEGSATTIESGLGAELIGNKWQKVQTQNIPIGIDTVVEFEFASNNIGEIHGIGFLSGSSIDNAKIFQLYGTQNWGINDFQYTGNGEFQLFSIPVGQYFTQSTLDLVLIMDDDAGPLTSDSRFRNIRIINN